MDILIICGTHLHDCIISIRGEVWAHKTSLTTPLFIEVSVPSQESDRSYICVMGIDFSIKFRSCSDSVVFLFHFPKFNFRHTILIVRDKVVFKPDTKPVFRNRLYCTT